MFSTPGPEDLAKLTEMFRRLSRAGLNEGNPPVGFLGGPDLPSLNGIRMRCTDVVLFAEMEGNTVIEYHPHLPYGFLQVEASELRVNTFVALIHRLDFKNAWDLRELHVFHDEYPLIFVEYKPKGLLGRFAPKTSPVFEYSLIGNRGPLGRYHGNIQERFDP